LARLAIRTSEECLPWMEEHGVRFQPSPSGTLSLAKTDAFFMGGGKSLVERPLPNGGGAGRRCAVCGCGRASGVECRSHRIAPKAVIVASGGFQADTNWLTRAWGEPAKNFPIRGTP